MSCCSTDNGINQPLTGVDSEDASEVVQLAAGQVCPGLEGSDVLTDGLHGLV